MSVKSYYICDHATWESFPKEHFRYSHWIETDQPGQIMVVAEFHTDAAWDFWEGTAGVQTLPHLILSTAPVSAKQAGMLVATLDAAPSDTTFDIATKAAAKHPLFRPDRI